MKHLLLALMTAMIFTPLSAETQNNIYKMPAVVISHETEANEDVTVFETSDGNIWANYGYTESKNVILVMDNNGTPEVVTDDIIIGVMK